jgi:hypothetical protein
MMLALSVMVVLLWVVSPVVLYQIGRFAHGLTQPRARRTRTATMSTPMSGTSASPERA